MERFILKKLLAWKNSPYRKRSEDAVMKIQPTLTSMKMKNISNFLRQQRMWSGFYKTL